MRASAAALLFVSLFLPFAYFNHSDGWNQGARLAELHAIVLQGTRADKGMPRQETLTEAQVEVIHA